MQKSRSRSQWLSGGSMKNEGWIYIVESKLNSKKIKIGSTSNQTPKQRLKNYATYGGILKL